MNRKIILIIAFISYTIVSLAQDKYWIHFNPINESTEDSNINPMYLDVLKNLDIQPIIYSSWLQAVSAVLTEEQKASLAQHHAVRDVESVREIYIQSLGINDSIVDFEERKLESLNYKAFQNAGLNGEGVKIGILDAGFLYYQESSISNVKIGGTQSFTDPKETDLNAASTYNYSEERPDGGIIKLFRYYRDRMYHGHGTVAAQLISGDAEIGQGGLAPKAELYLGKTEEGLKEYKAEEDYWVAGLEWLHSQGVRLVNTSLGYAKGRDDRSENYKRTEMNGSSMIARAAQKAIKEKDMILVVSAGNEGGKPFWRVLSTPADAQDVISVGATKPHSYLKEKYSSIGPDFIDYIKPDVSAISATGTSFSAPLITGFIGCMLQKDSTLTSSEAKSLLERSAQLYPYKNNYIGYGLPQADKVLALMDEPDIDVAESREVSAEGKTYTIQQHKMRFITVFHKADAHYVNAQERIEAENGQFIIKRKKRAKRSTILNGREVIEIYWD